MGTTSTPGTTDVEAIAEVTDFATLIEAPASRLVSLGYHARLRGRHARRGRGLALDSAFRSACFARIFVRRGSRVVDGGLAVYRGLMQSK